jgi:hypothetical protein
MLDPEVHAGGAGWGLAFIVKEVTDPGIYF